MCDIRKRLLAGSADTAALEARKSLWLPPRNGIGLPVVIRLHGSDGEFDEIRSSLLADEGFAVLDLRYIDPSGVPEIVEVPIETVSDAVDWLSRDRRIK